MTNFARIVFLALTLVGSAIAESRTIVWRFAKGEEVMSRATTADRVEVVAAPPQAGAPTVLTEAQAKQLVALFRFSAEPLRGVKLVINGVEAWETLPCQCLGDYLLRFSKGADTLIEFTVHHRQFIRLIVDGHYEEFDLVPTSGEAVQSFLDRLEIPRSDVRESKLVPLTVVDSWAPDQLEVRRALIAGLENEQLQPHQYYVEIGGTVRDGKIEYHLWHEARLKDLESVSGRGDPTGLCRTAVYDLNSRSVVRMYRWQ